MLRPDRALALYLSLLLPTIATMGCGHPPAPMNPRAAVGPTLAPESLAGSQQIGGSWDLVEARQEGEDRLVDQHELQLRWLGNDVVGVWDRSRSWLAAPGRAFVETNSQQCLLRRRHLLRGRIRADGGFSLAPVRSLAHARSTCAAPLPLPQDCVARRRDTLLELRCARQLLLFSRRSEPATPLALAMAPPGEVTGIWTWHHRSVDGEGDLKIEHETWHLIQRGSQVEGFYDRTVRMRSRDGRPFRCNDELGYRNSARFRVRGLIAGREVYLKEISYSTAPSDCETGQRRLDRYIGVLEAGSGRIQLRWRSGAQFLRRRH